MSDRQRRIRAAIISVHTPEDNSPRAIEQTVTEVQQQMPDVSRDEIRDALYQVLPSDEEVALVNAVKAAIADAQLTPMISSVALMTCISDLIIQHCNESKGDPIQKAKQVGNAIELSVRTLLREITRSETERH